MWRLPPASNEFKSIFIVSDFLRILMAFFIVKNMLLLVELNVEMKGKIGLPIRYFRACKNSNIYHYSSIILLVSQDSC